MNQLILDTGGYAILLPESRKGGYTAYEEPLSVDLVMLPGNMVRELRGTVWRVNYQYGYFTDEEKNNLLAACRKGRNEPILCAFLPPNSTEMISSEFFVTSFASPKFMWSREGKPMWGDFSVELREVTPHD